MKPQRSVLLLSLGVGLLSAGAGAEVLERVLVRVRGDIITQSDFEARQVSAVQAARVPMSGVEAYLRENNARLLQEAIDELLVVQRGYELGIRPSDEYVASVVDSIKKENAIESDAELQRQLRREGMSIDDLKRNIERSVVRQEVLRRELQARSKVTDAEARAEYEANKATEYTQRPAVHLQEIVLPESATRGEAEALAQRARGGEDFAALARERSVGPTREAGGDLGRLSRGDLAADVEQVAFSLEAGGVSDPLPLPSGGFRVLKVVEKTPGREVPFEEVKDEIIQRMTQRRAATQYQEYVEGLRKKAEPLTQLRVREVPLQVDLPVDTGGPTLAPGALAPVAPAAPSGADEFSVTPQARPDRVAPPPAPQPSPSPSPGPR